MKNRWTGATGTDGGEEWCVGRNTESILRSVPKLGPWGGQGGSGHWALQDEQVKIAEALLVSLIALPGADSPETEDSGERGWLND